MEPSHWMLTWTVCWVQWGAGWMLVQGRCVLMSLINKMPCGFGSTECEPDLVDGAFGCDHPVPESIIHKWQIWEAQVNAQKQELSRQKRVCLTGHLSQKFVACNILFGTRLVLKVSFARNVSTAFRHRWMLPSEMMVWQMLPCNVSKFGVVMLCLRCCRVWCASLLSTWWEFVRSLQHPSLGVWWQEIFKMQRVRVK